MFPVLIINEDRRREPECQISRSDFARTCPTTDETVTGVSPRLLDTYRTVIHIHVYSTSGFHDTVTLWSEFLVLRLVGCNLFVKYKIHLKFSRQQSRRWLAGNLHASANQLTSIAYCKRRRYGNRPRPPKDSRTRQEGY